jgi:hypothetical protein
MKPRVCRLPPDSHWCREPEGQRRRDDGDEGLAMGVMVERCAVWTCSPTLAFGLGLLVRRRSAGEASDVESAIRQRISSRPA